MFEIRKGVLVNLFLFYKNLLKSKLKWIRLALIWFGISFVVGAAFFVIRPELLLSILKMFEDRFGANPALDMNLVLEIFSQNLSVSSVALLGGLVFSIPAFIIVAANGFILGFIMLAILLSDLPGLEATRMIVGGLLPHAIFELPSFIIACAFGMALSSWLGREAKGHRLAALKQGIADIFYIFPAIGVVLFVAALIEVFVSGNLVK